MDNSEIICHCMQVTRGDIIDAIKAGNLTTVEQVGEATDAGTGCGGCQSVVQEILDEING
ncbi:MAG: (2Fe-2S)-binding protein [Bacteroidales bacterium]|nr:(2Fe-2S)-binding protein [Bacteroidales bacterium]